jgi:ferredoxin-type protein NapG
LKDMATTVKTEVSDTRNQTPNVPGRRKFFGTLAQGVGLSLIGGALWGSYLKTTKSSPLVLRPPGAIPEKDFIKACIKCGLCAQACKQRDNRGTRDTTLKLAYVGEEPLIGTPYFVPRDTPCYLCEDMPCTQACPTGALDSGTVCSKVTDQTNDQGDESWYGTNCKTEDLDVNKARMGIALIDENSCVAYHEWGLQCDICYRVCPLMDSAISLKYERNERTGKHAFLVPVVHRDACTGCGICEERCITEEAAIKIIPLSLVSGKAGDHYRRGWLEEQELSDKAANEKDKKVRNVGPNQSKEGTAQGYLNEGIEFDEETL